MGRTAAARKPAIDHRAEHAADLAEDRRAAIVAAVDVETLGSATAAVGAYAAAAPPAIGVFTVDQPDDPEPGVVEVPLSRLSVHPDNVRRTGRKGKVDDLIASIRARGLLQNLLVVADSAKPGYWLVKVGGRRLRALNALAKEGAIGADHPVSIRILGDGEHAAEASLAENLHRVALNVADEIAAFAVFVAAGDDVPAIAARFGVDERHVRGRLRLATLHDKVMNALRDGTISLDSAKAYASVDDAARQAEVFGDSYGRNDPGSIRAKMRTKLAKPTDASAILVGRDAYLAAGGRIETDLFTDASEEVWLDPGILLGLAEQALYDGADDLQRRFGFGKMVLADRSWGMPAEDDVAGLKVFGERQDWTMLPEGQRSQLLVSAMITREGRVGLFDTAWLISGEMIALPAEDRLPARPEPDDDARDFPPGRPGAAEDADGRTDAEASPAGGWTSSAAEPVKTPDSVRDMLAMRRRDVLRLCLGERFDVAADLAAFVLADSVVGPKEYMTDKHASAIANHDRAEPIPNATWEDDLAGHLADQRAALADAWVTIADVEARWLAFRSLPSADRAAWLAWATAASLKAWENNYTRTGSALHDAIGVSIEVQPHVYWRPTAANYFGRVRRAGCLAFLTEVGVPAMPKAGWTKFKAGALADLCAAVATGDAREFGLGPDGLDDATLRAIGDAGATWVPEGMRFGGAI